MQHRDLTDRFCPTHGQWITPVREVHFTTRGLAYTQWLCPLHDATNRTPDDPHYASEWPQVHMEFTHNAANTR